MDFEVEELSSPLDSQVITWRLELPPHARDAGKTEGNMRIYTTQRDFVGLAPLVMVSTRHDQSQHHPHCRDVPVHIRMGRVRAFWEVWNDWPC